MSRDKRSLLFVVLSFCIGCYRSDLDHPRTGATDKRTQFSVVVTPTREFDILFMVDNSPSMDPKQAALADNFPAMMAALQRIEGGLPNVHIGVISSDFGAGGGEMGANCSTPLGNRGLLWGNDNSLSAMAGRSELYNQFATVAGGTTNGCGLNQGARWIEDTRTPGGTGRQKNYSGELADVFSCLAKAPGNHGCGEEHQLQSIRMALNPVKGLNEANLGFLRWQAYLAIIMVTDEDDCSADPYSGSDHKPNNDKLFTPNGLTIESTSLRCAGRGHVCNGKAIPNYDPSFGYDGSKGPLSLNFADCAAKEPKNPPDYHWLPLIPVQAMIDDVIKSKNGNKDKIVVSGIIGWPENGDPTGAQYRIDKDLTSLPMSLQSLWEYMPICSLPQVKSADGNIYKAYGGLRLKKFIDGFGANGKTLSICNNDFTQAMTQIGTALARKSAVGCADYPLPDIDPSIEGVQPDCLANLHTPCDSPGHGSCLAIGYEESPVSQCKNPSGLPPNPDVFQPDAVPDGDRPCWYLGYDTGEPGCGNSFQGQKISVLLKAGQTVPEGTSLAMNCLTQLSSP
jgi:hypothetical protein